MNIIHISKIPNASIILLCYSKETIDKLVEELEHRDYRMFSGHRLTEYIDTILEKYPLPVGLRLMPEIREINYAPGKIYERDWPETPKFRVVL